jgi:hypothetical protein
VHVIIDDSTTEKVSAAIVTGFPFRYRRSVLRVPEAAASSALPAVPSSGAERSGAE